MALNLFAQTKPDVLVKTNGEEMKGKIVKVTDTDVSFIYSGETAEYVIKKSDIAKLVHGSGRIETFSDVAAQSVTRKSDGVAMTASPVDHHNKIAILPFTYLMDNQPGADQIGIKAQQDTYTLLSQHTAGYTLLDPRTTNALLAKAGVTKDKMMGYTMKEICDLLSVEYIIEGTVTQNKGYQTNSSVTSGSTKVKRNDNNSVTGVKGSESNYGNSVQRYDVSVNLNVYMDNNASIFSQTHKAFLSNTDGSYSGPLEYLLKRSPIYRK